MRIKLLMAVLTAGLVLAPMTTTAGGMARTRPVTTFSVRLNAVGGSRESGWARFNRGASPSTTIVNISVMGEAAGANQPAHIHTGTCAAPGPVTFGLANVMGGASTTRLSQRLSWFKSSPFIVVIHKSNTQLGVYRSCGTHRGS